MCVQSCLSKEYHTANNTVHWLQITGVTSEMSSFNSWSFLLLFESLNFREHVYTTEMTCFEKPHKILNDLSKLYKFNFVNKYK